MPHKSHTSTLKPQTSVPRVADREALSLLLDKARQFETRFASLARSSLPLRLYFLSRKSLSSIAGEYIDSLEERPVFPSEKSLRAMDALVEPLPENPSDPFLVLDQLQEIGAPAVVAQSPNHLDQFV